jgi:hypothetical protein
MFSIVSLQRFESDPTFYEPGFRHLLEVHLPLIRANPETVRVDIPPDKVFQFEFDFYGYLTELGIKPHHHWLYLRCNYMFSPEEFGKEQYHEYNPKTHWELIRPSMEYVASLKKRYLTEIQ